MISFHPQMHTDLKTGCTEFHPSMRRSSKDHSANQAMTTSFIQKSSLLAALADLGGGAALMRRSDAVAQAPQVADAPAISVTTVRAQGRDIPLYLAGGGTATAHASGTGKGG